MADLRYPIGEFEYPQPLNADERTAAIGELAALPQQVRQAVEDLTEEQLETPYRPDGWTVRQVVHHLADSHLNGYLRTKLALTESNPTIRPYEQDGWAALPDTFQTPVRVSLDLLDALHTRWANLYALLDEADFSRTFYHPANQVTSTLDRHLANYIWHGQHHLAHITALRERMGW
jgi:uncharacterized damage-inducible protein DinB